jgi:hypothetical protein
MNGLNQTEPATFSILLCWTFFRNSVFFSILSARALRGCGFDVQVNPELFVKDENVKNILGQELPDLIKLGQWKRVTIEKMGKRK